MNASIKSSFALILLLTIAAGCNRSGTLQVKNRISRTVIENIYWGEVYVGGNLKPGEQTDLIEVTRHHESLPATNRLFFSASGSGFAHLEYYTDEKFELDKKGQLIIELTDSTLIFELD